MLNLEPNRIRSAALSARAGSEITMGGNRMDGIREEDIAHLLIALDD